jgi:glycosyltransferase involved in cell wall biosynthesis
MRIGLVVPHIFMHQAILPGVIFSPGSLALQLAEGLEQLGAEVTLFSPGPVKTTVRNVTADLSLFETELKGRGDSYLDLLKKHPLTFVSLARQVQAEIIAKAFAMANRGELDVVHIYTNEEDIALPFAAFCSKPVVFTHHDPFSFLIKYKNVFPKYKHLNWISLSLAQRKGMPADTNWVANIYHGLPEDAFRPVAKPKNDYVAFLGRIIEPKGAHLAIAAVKEYNASHPEAKLKLKIAGKHYTGHHKDAYWQEKIEPQLDDDEVEYLGFIGDLEQKNDFLGNAKALLVPSTFEEPFGMVLIEALACGTPVIGLDSGAIPEIIKHGLTGLIIKKTPDESQLSGRLAQAIHQIGSIDRTACRADFLARFTLKQMSEQHYQTYEALH